jgi:hypothetical protein
MPGIEIIGLAFATAGVIDLIIKYGVQLADAVSELSVEDEVVHNFDMFAETQRKQLRLIIANGQPIMTDPHVSDENKESLDDTFQEIQKAMISSQRRVEELKKTKLRGKAMRLINSKRRLQGLEEDVKRMRRFGDDFRHTVFMVRNLETGRSPACLSPETFQPSGLVTAHISQEIRIVQCHLTSKSGRVGPKNGLFLLEARSYMANTKPPKEGDLRVLAQHLVSAEPSDGILDAAGYMDDVENNRFELVFSVPDSLHFRGTLEDLLHTVPTAPSLSVRHNICLQLANSILHVHGLKLVHKNINPTNILVMEPEALNIHGGQHIKDLSIFLCNWQLVRQASRASNKAGERLWWNAIYQHPTRQYQLAQQEYNMGHDIYSLGVCMLEVLVWKKLVQRSENGPSISPWFKDRAVSLIGMESIEENAEEEMTEAEKFTANREGTKNVLVDLARTDIPGAAGDILAKLTVSCLMCLEDGFRGLSFGGRDILEVGMDFVAVVKSTLEVIKV